MPPEISARPGESLPRSAGSGLQKPSSALRAQNTTAARPAPCAFSIRRIIPTARPSASITRCMRMTSTTSATAPFCHGWPIRSSRNCLPAHPASITEVAPARRSQPCCARPGTGSALYDPLFAPDRGVLQATYDFVTCTETAEHFHDPALEFARLDALLRPGGLLGLMTVFQNDDTRFRRLALPARSHPCRLLPGRDHALDRQPFRLALHDPASRCGADAQAGDVGDGICEGQT